MSVLTKEDFDDLKSPALEMISQLKTHKETWRRENKYCQYVLDHLDVLPVNDNDRIRKASSLIYFSYLLQCYQLNYKSLKVKDPLPHLPSRIKNKIFSLFSLQQKNTRCIPKRLKDKLVCYIIVLALIIDGYTIDCMVLCKDLKMALQRFCNFAKSVGCNIESNQGLRKRKLDEDTPAGFKRAILQVPLPKDFPNHIAFATRKR